MKGIIQQNVTWDLFGEGRASIITLTIVLKMDTIETDWDNNHLSSIVLLMKLWFLGVLRCVGVHDTI
jgi:hypothetical protein